MNTFIEQQKAKVMDELKNGILNYVKAKLGMGTGN